LEESKYTVVLFDSFLLESQQLEIQERSKGKFLVGKQGTSILFAGLPATVRYEFFAFEVNE
jgi:hypothetical protein